MSWNDRIHTGLAQRYQQHLSRQRKQLDSPQAAEVYSGNRTLLNFCSNDYLGLAAEGGTALAEAAQRWGFGSGASHLVCGHSTAHHALEAALAAHVGYPRALLFSSGFMANLGVLSALAQRGDFVFQDKLNHASLLDGAQLSRATMKRFAHADYAALAQQLNNTTGHTAAEKLIVSDSIFSMDGDLADVPRLSRLAQQHNALLMIDDAHGFGLLGENGRGVRAHFGLSCTDLPVYIGTLGKALGGYGAFVAGSEALIDYLIQFARPYIYTTALPPALAEAMQQQLIRLQRPQRRQQLQHNIAYFRAGAQSLNLPIMQSQSAIQPLLIGDAAQAMSMSQALIAQGLWISAIRPPTVPAGSARLRITLTACHRESQIDQLLDALAHLPLIPLHNGATT